MSVDSLTNKLRKTINSNQLTLIVGLLLIIILPFYIKWATKPDNAENKEEKQGWSVQTVPNTRLQGDFIHVSDPDNIIDDYYEDSINAILSSIRIKADIFVVALNMIDNPSGDVFTNELFNYWGVGERGHDNGVLVVMTMEPHFIRIETGYGMEEVLPDVVCHRIIRDNVLPDFKQNNYSDGMLKCAKSLASVVTGEKYDGIVDVLGNTMSQPLDDVEYGNNNNGNSADNSTTLLDLLKLSFNALILFLRLWYLLAFYLCPIYSLYHIYKFVRIGMNYANNRIEDENRAYGIAARECFANKIYVWKCLVFPLAIVTAIWFVLIGYYFRHKKRICPTCNKTMHLLSKAEVDEYLTELQIRMRQSDIEEYDVWKSECGNWFVEYYEGANYSLYVECPNCGVHMSKIVIQKTQEAATLTKKGTEWLSCECINCQHQHSETRKLEPHYLRLIFWMVLKTLIKLLLLSLIKGKSGGGRSGRGGSFGGGRSGGGGSSSSW